MLNFLGIGAQKSGTTWIYRNLMRHPDIMMPDQKEVHFWDIHYDKGIAWYNSLFETANDSIKSGEITPSYSILPKDKIREIHENYPDLKLIYIIRNPAERAWSSALMGLKRAEMTIDDASDQWFVDHFNSRGSLMRGDYETCIKNWLEFYEKEKLLLLHYDEMKSSPLEMLKKCARHIEIDEDFFDTIDEKILMKKEFAGSGYPLRESLKSELNNIYSQKTESLSNYLKSIRI